MGDETTRPARHAPVPGWAAFLFWAACPWALAAALLLPPATHAFGAGVALLGALAYLGARLRPTWDTLVVVFLWSTMSLFTAMVSAESWPPLAGRFTEGTVYGFAIFNFLAALAFAGTWAGGAAWEWRERRRRGNGGGGGDDG